MFINKKNFNNVSLNYMFCCNLNLTILIFNLVFIFVFFIVCIIGFLLLFLIVKVSDIYVVENIIDDKSINSLTDLSDIVDITDISDYIEYLWFVNGIDVDVKEKC